MIKRSLLALGMLLGTLCTTEAQTPFPGFSTPPGVSIQDEGIAQGRARTLNCTGAGITCSVAAGVATLNATGGGGSSNFIEVSVSLSTEGGLVYTATITGQAWVTGTSIIVCNPFATSADGQTLETVYASNVQPVISNRVAGTGFDLSIFTPYGATGTYRFHCVGA